MKKNLLLIITILISFIFINTVKAEDIPKGDYTFESTFYLDLNVLDVDGNNIKEISICYGSSEYCYDMELQDNGLYKEETETYSKNYSYSLSDWGYSYDSVIYIMAEGYKNSGRYNVIENYTSKYKLSGTTVINTRLSSFEDLGKIILKKNNSIESKGTKECSVVSGTGKNIGDEVACGTEHFYVISNDGKEVKLLAKYNLYVGANWNKKTMKLDDSASLYDNEFEELVSSKFGLNDTYYVITKLGKNNKGTFGYYGSWYDSDGNIKIYTYTNITSDEEGYALQSEKALGVTGEKGKANYPIIGTTLLFPYRGNCGDEFSSYVNSLDNFKNGYTNFELNSDSEIKEYLNDYEDNLEQMGFDITSTNLMSIEELNDLVKNITDKELPLSDWYNSSLSEEENEDDVYELGNLKEYISDDYSWIWNTSYWTRTIYGNDISLSEDPDLNNYYFVSSQGTICYSESDCWGTIPRAGIRPIVTMSASQIYNVYTKDDGNGTITYERKDGVVHFTLTPKEGYVLGEVKVTDADGNTITFTDYTFTMPSADVTIEAIFKKIDNPLTSDIAIITIALLLVISLITFLIQSKKLNKKIS